MGVNRTAVPAEQITKGMFLDPSCKIRVHTDALVRNGRVTIGYRLRGSRAPGVQIVRQGVAIGIYTKEN